MKRLLFLALCFAVSGCATTGQRSNVPAIFDHPVPEIFQMGSDGTQPPAVLEPAGVIQAPLYPVG